ncbi:hypothetical protein NE852_32005 (plasmid) [Rhizobium sp. Pop5]|nr:IclR family transcriptional regulator C-terminal domain-containing protein [Rhizobium sp. Pop5]EJZ18521.1 DNA-binding transcriptional activator MhpR [Rhizobium sp. Pop5]UVD60371.1 hypothetical protein NE852_32005 [Rhizobium sp. Pop5]
MRPHDLSVYEKRGDGHYRGMIGYRMPVLRTSAGRAYLAFISDEERRLVVEHIRRLAVPEDLSFLEAIDMSDFLADIRAKGYATREAGEFRPSTSSIAVPVMPGGVMTACISIIWIRSALSIKEATARYVEPLMEIAERLAAAVETEQRVPFSTG